MENSTTTGGDYAPDAPNCAHCALDTTGTHQADCPLHELQRLQRAKALEFQQVDTILTRDVKIHAHRGHPVRIMPKELDHG